MTLTSFVFTELTNTMKYGRGGSYITLFSPSDITAFYGMKYGVGVSYNIFSPSDVTVFHRIHFESSTSCMRILQSFTLHFYSYITLYFLFHFISNKSCENSL